MAGPEQQAGAPGADAVADLAASLRTRGLRTLTGVVSDTGGVIRGKSVPAARVEDFARAGMGASPSWAVFCVDRGIAFTDDLNAVGDLRLVADLSAAQVLDGGFGWAPADVRDQAGMEAPSCWRGTLRRQVARLGDLGISARVGHELELTLFEADGERVAGEIGWQPYGAGSYSEVSGFAADVCDRLAEVGLPVEQIHAEYGVGQVELSLPPRDPVSAADSVLLARAVIARTARAHALRSSFSPVPVAGGSGNGAHLHLSLERDGYSFIGGGEGPAGLTETGGQAVAGLTALLPEAMAVLAGTVVSGVRMKPHHWAGAFSCWGVENREAAVRLVQAGPGNPGGANLEVKCVDAGANTYLATALVLGFAAYGVEWRLRPPPPVGVDPADLDQAEARVARAVPMPDDAEARIALFEASSTARGILGPVLHRAVVAVRRHEATAYADRDPHVATRFAWSG